MSDIYEVVIQDNAFELVAVDEAFEVAVDGDNLSLVVDDYPIEFSVANTNIEVVTIAEQGPSGVFGIAIGNTAPTSPAIGDLWLDTN